MGLRPTYWNESPFLRFIDSKQVTATFANEETLSVTDTNLIIGNASVPACAYALYLLPERREPWKLILNKTTGQLGLPYPGESSDLARIDMDSELQRKTVEQFTIAFESQSDNAATLSLEWEGWRAAVKVAKQL